MNLAQHKNKLQLYDGDQGTNEPREGDKVCPSLDEVKGVFTLTSVCEYD